LRETIRRVVSADRFDLDRCGEARVRAGPGAPAFVFVVKSFQFGELPPMPLAVSLVQLLDERTSDYRRFSPY
jgi:hypothetical protein